MFFHLKSVTLLIKTFVFLQSLSIITMISIHFCKDLRLQNMFSFLKAKITSSSYLWLHMLHED